MIKVLSDMLPHVKLEDELSNPIVLEDGKYKITGLRPQPTAESRKILMEKGVTLSDLFFLEPPHTFDDLKYRAERYSLNIDIQLILIT